MPNLELKRNIVLGAMNNTVFAAAGGTLMLLQAVLVIRLLGPRDMGEFAVAAAFATTLEFISDFGIGDCLVQQSDDTVQEATQVALTLQVLAAVPLWAVVFFAAPAISRSYALPGLSTLIRLMSFQAFGGVCRLPLFTLYRELKYFQHRLLLFIGKVAAFVTTVALALSGYGAWSLAIGGIVGLAATCIPAWYLTPIAPRWRFRLVHALPLFSFSWPVWLSRVTLMIVEQGTVVVVSLLLSVQELGQFKSTEQLSHFAILIEVIFAQTIFPVLCRARDSSAKLSAMVSRTGRAAMLFVGGAGFGLLIFAHQTVVVVLGAKWEGAELFFQANGIGLLLAAIAFNWEAVLRAVGDTKPIFRVSIIYGSSFFLILCPLTYVYGKRGTAASIVIVNLIGFLARSYYFNRLRLSTSMPDMVWRALAAGIAASLGIELLRSVIGPAESLSSWALELTVYFSTYSLILWRLERSLIHEVRDIFLNRKVMVTTG